MTHEKFTITPIQMPDTHWEAKAVYGYTVFHTKERHEEEEDAIKDVKEQIDEFWFNKKEEERNA